MGRAERRKRTRRIIRRRLQRGKNTLMGLDDVKEAQPHRMHKHKNKFTQDNGSLKKGKQKANRAARAEAKRLAKQGKEPPPRPKNSVKWDYW